MGVSQWFSGYFQTVLGFVLHTSSLNFVTQFCNIRYYLFCFALFFTLRHRYPPPPPSCDALRCIFALYLTQTTKPFIVGLLQGRRKFHLSFDHLGFLYQRPEGQALCEVTQSTLVAQLIYASSSWSGFAKAEERAKLQSILNKASRYGFLPGYFRTIDRIIRWHLI